MSMPSMPRVTQNAMMILFWDAALDAQLLSCERVIHDDNLRRAWNLS